MCFEFDRHISRTLAAGRKPVFEAGTGRPSVKAPLLVRPKLLKVMRLRRRLRRNPPRPQDSGAEAEREGSNAAPGCTLVGASTLVAIFQLLSC